MRKPLQNDGFTKAEPHTFVLLFIGNTMQPYLKKTAELAGFCLFALGLYVVTTLACRYLPGREDHTLNTEDALFSVGVGILFWLASVWGEEKRIAFATCGST